MLSRLEASRMKVLEAQAFRKASAAARTRDNFANFVMVHESMS